MIVGRQQLSQIRARSAQDGVLCLPVRIGRFGERKACPARQGGIYCLRARVPYELYVSMAEREPSRARAVLYLIERVSRPTPTVTVTVLAVGRQQVEGVDTWVVRYRKGEHRDLFERPMYLSKIGDLTTQQSRQAIPGDPEVVVLPGEGERARMMEIAQRAQPHRENVKRAANEIDTLKGALFDMKARRRAELISRELAKLANELPPDAELHCA